MNKKNKIFIIIFLGAIIFIFYQLGFFEYLKLDYLKNHLNSAQVYFSTHPFGTILIYSSVYIVATALSFPGATILSLFAGALFGTFYGVIIVLLASTIGATFSFWITRFLLNEYVEKKFPKQIASINKNIEKEGAFYLFSLRLIPVFPFFLVNMVMGLTSISTGVYFLISLTGMIPGTIAYVYAGKKFSELTSISGILNPGILLVFTIIGITPLLAKILIEIIRMKRLYKKYKKPKKFDFNMIVIGGGAAGLVTSYISAVVRSKVLLIEKQKMGGDCLNYGCVPSKALIKICKFIHLASKAQSLGIKEVEIEFNFLDIMKRIKHVISSIEPHDSIERYTKLGVECMTGEAKIISPYEVKVGDKVFTTKNITIATGAKPFVPMIKGIENANYVTSDTIWNLKILPKRFLVLGGGAIGCELAQCFSRLGSDVTLVEKASCLLTREDFEVSSLLKEILINEGMKIITNCEVSEFVIEGDIKYAVLFFGGKVLKIEYDIVLISLGRKANVKGFGLEELDITVKENGLILTNEYLQTSYPNVFACGDVAGPYQLTHMAAHQAWYCAVNGLFHRFKKFKVDYSVVPWCTYTDPEVATVGINEETAKKLNLEYETTVYYLDGLDRAIVDDETKGFVKVITKKGSDKILGATIIGNEASNVILEFISAMKFKKGLNQILETIHIYPTLGEANKYVAGIWKERHASKKLLSWLDKYFRWDRG